MTMSARIRAHCASGSRRARRAARLRGERARARILPEPAAAVRTRREHADARQVPPADDAREVPDRGLSRERELHELVLGDPRCPRLDLAYQEAIGRWAAHGWFTTLLPEGRRAGERRCGSGAPALFD